MQRVRVEMNCFLFNPGPFIAEKSDDLKVISYV